MYRQTLGFVTDTEYVVLTPEIVVPPGEWPVVKPEHVFDNVRLNPGLLNEAIKHAQKSVDTAVVLGAQIDYSVTLESSVLTGCTAWILRNNEVISEKGFLLLAPMGTIKSGSVLIPKDKIMDKNTLTIILSHVPATFNVCVFDVHVTLGYSEEPSFDTPWEDKDELPWQKWLLYGAVGLGAFLFLTRGGTKVIVVKSD